MQRAMNVAGRMGAWSATHWKTAVFGWIAFVVVFAYIGNAIVGLKQIDQNDAGVGQSHQADQILKKAFPERAPQTEFVLVQSATRTTADPAFRATVGDVLTAVRSKSTIENLKSPLRPAACRPGQRRSPFRARLVGDERRRRQASDNIDAVSAATEKVATRHPAFYVGHAGVARTRRSTSSSRTSSPWRVNARSRSRSSSCYSCSEALVAVGIPILLALTGVVATIGLVAVTSHVVPADSNVNAVDPADRPRRRRRLLALLHQALA